MAEGLLNWHALTDASIPQQAFLIALTEQAWSRYHVDGQWRLGDDALLRWGGTELALADTVLPAPPAVLMRVTRNLGLHPPRSVGAERAAWPAVIAEPFRHASYLDLCP